jgi:Tfp pilus assembly protein FimV
MRRRLGTTDGHLVRRTHTRLVTAALVAVLVGAAGCGSSSSSKSTTTTESAAAQRTAWANSFCGSLVSWRSALKSVGTQLKNGQITSKTALANAAGQLETATKTLADSLKGLGKPPTPGAEKAKSAVDQLSQQLSSGADQLKSETANVSGAQGVLGAITSAGTTISAMANDVSATITQLKSIDAQGAWKQAFSQASSCKTLSGP